MAMRMNFELLKDDEKKIVGVELVGDGSTEAKIWAATFPRALAAGRATIGFSGKKIFFNHLKGEFPATFTFELSEEEIDPLRTVFRYDQPLKSESSEAWCGGFKLFLPNELPVAS